MTTCFPEKVSGSITRESASYPLSASRIGASRSPIKWFAPSRSQACPPVRKNPSGFLKASIARQAIARQSAERGMSHEFLCSIHLWIAPSRAFLMHCRAMDDMVILAHIREQHRLSLQSYGRPRMTEELQELGVNVGQRRVGRLMRENGIKIIRTQKYKLLGHPKDALPANGLQRTATMRSTSRQICWIKIFLPPGQTRNGPAIYPISGPVKDGFILPSFLICILVVLSAPSR